MPTPSGGRLRVHELSDEELRDLLTSTKREIQTFLARPSPDDIEKGRRRISNIAPAQKGPDDQRELGRD